ncbi:MAG: hypothetical protein OXU27_03670 [Candidatus Poribacteria bacterium]|nr:hypothetical protein [Candidatus Poribacteria bacterium]MDE0325380.1 hypothetical protein [Candidatus Poribacteria bacterium]
MFDRAAKVSKVTWKTVLLNPLIFGTMAIPSDSDSALLLIATGVVLAASGLIPLSIPRVRISTFIACGIICILGCGVGSLGMANILERQFPNYPTVSQWEWTRWLPSAFENLAILIWVYVVLNISPVTRSLSISAILVAAAAGYSLTSDALAIRDALVFGVTREIADWEQAMEFLLNGCALVAWVRLIIRKLASTSVERFTGRCMLFVGGTFILVGIFGILWDIFS